MSSAQQFHPHLLDPRQKFTSRYPSMHLLSRRMLDLILRLTASNACEKSSYDERFMGQHASKPAQSRGRDRLATELGLLILFRMSRRTRGRFLLWCVREIARFVCRRVHGSWLGLDFAAEFWRGGATTSTTNVFLGFGGGITSVLFHGRGSLLGVVAGEVGDLLCLSVDDFGSV